MKNIEPQIEFPGLTETIPSTYILNQLDVYNWGPFSGRHSAKIDSRGTAIIGPTGSGKTTLVDALMTLIAAQPKYNLASTGGHESDRDLMSYIRGVSGAGNSADNSHVARPNKTVTGISASFSNGTQSIQIAAVLWVDGPSTAATDRKDLWIISERDDHSLDDWLSIHHKGGSRALKQYCRDTDKIYIDDVKKKYLVRLREFFEVSENAFALLNRAAGLKQLNSIDEIFRELVLEDRSVFDRAAEVAKEFDDLASIHAELEIARKQRNSLLPIERDYSQYKEIESSVADKNQLDKVVPTWFAMAGHRLWGKKSEELQKSIRELDDKIGDLRKEELSLQSKANDLKERYLKVGGNTIDQLEKHIGSQKEIIATRKKNADEYQIMMRSLGRHEGLEAEHFRENKKWASEQADNLSDVIEQKRDDLFEIGAVRKEHQKNVNQLEEEIKKVKANPRSNIDGIYLDFREKLASHLNMSIEALPYVAELVEVKKEESLWRGAIERAIGGHRLRVLVPSDRIRAALRWVNDRDNRIHVRLLEARQPYKTLDFHEDGFSQKLNYKKHSFGESLKDFIASIDRHCVDSPEQLSEIPHSLTVEGAMSGRAGQSEKQDHTALNKGWLTGFDNKDRLATLLRDLNDATITLNESQKKYATSERELGDLENSRNFVARLTRLEFGDVDLPGAELELSRLNERLQILCDPKSDVSKARKDCEIAEKKLGELREKINSSIEESGKCKGKYETAHANQQIAAERIGPGLEESLLALAKEQLPSLENDPPENLEQLERETRRQITNELKGLNNKLDNLGKELVRHMGDAKNADTGALNEVGREMSDIPAYLARLKVLNDEALPEKLQRFISYLNQSSDQGVTQLLADIENEVTFIEERINDLNVTLKKVDFQPDRYLQLVPQRIVHESLRDLQSRQRHLRFATLKDDQGESHYRALENVVKVLREASENKRTVGAKALLDPRYRLQFSVSFLNRHSGELIETRTGSQGGSGGEKEGIASYILTASLSYALCPEGAPYPLFGTIILDEAFSKSSQGMGGRIVSALREFGLHPVFVTPNKEMRLLREHTRSAVLVHRKQFSASLTCMSWEELETHAQKVMRNANEVT